MIIAIWCRHTNTNIIAVNGEIPWYSRQDKKFFRRVSKLGSVAMGKNTYNDIKINNPSFFDNQNYIVLSSQDSIENIKYKTEHLILAGGCRIYYDFLTKTKVDVIYDSVYKGFLDLCDVSNKINISSSIDILENKYTISKTFKIEENVICNKWILTTKL